MFYGIRTEAVILTPVMKLYKCRKHEHNNGYWQKQWLGDRRKLYTDIDRGTLGNDTYRSLCRPSTPSSSSNSMLSTHLATL